MSMSNNFNAMDMANSVAAANDTSVDGLFMKKGDAPQTGATISEQQHVSTAAVAGNPTNTKGWVPDASLTADLPEFSEPVTFAPDEIKTEDADKSLRNLSDDDAMESSATQKDEMVRMNDNIEAAKARFGIRKLQVPPGKHQVYIYNAASDTDSERAAAKLDAAFEEIIKLYPEFILEWDPNSEYAKTTGGNKSTESEESSQTEDGSENKYTYTKADSINNTDDVPSNDDMKVVIDKRSVPTVTWTDDEMDKIRKSRTVELNIVEGKPIEFSEIKKASRNVVDDVISKYVRKKGDVTAALPASRYRCTFTGLSYPEVLDLSNSTDLNTMDGEIKKWTICFNHMRNMSIGEWDEYQWYLHPTTNERVRMLPEESVPVGIDPEQVHVHTKFQDFLEKTSFMDLNFMIWKVLCATCMDTEIIQIDCHANLDGGGQCTNHYDWIYSPADLLDMDAISEAVLEEMKATSEASGSDSIMDNYRESFLVKDRTVKLADSGFYAVFGHISAKKYLDEICPVIKSLERQTEEAARNNTPLDPSIATTGLNYTTLTIIKSFIVESEDGMVEISETEDVLDVIKNLGEIDWQSIGELVRISMEPYDFNYSIKGLVCPKCKNKSKINIENMSMLLFIVARSLSSVQVEFKTN